MKGCGYAVTTRRPVVFAGLQKWLLDTAAPHPVLTFCVTVSLSSCRWRLRHSYTDLQPHHVCSQRHPLLRRVLSEWTCVAAPPAGECEDTSTVLSWTAGGIPGSTQPQLALLTAPSWRTSSYVRPRTPSDSTRRIVMQAAPQHATRPTAARPVDAATLQPGCATRS